ncbi:protein of unknown function [Nitrospira japonica]|uniref:Ice-binding protein C-terminal domain-containing protein n=1 Tax=Nitrospira japonica TaxID=1325564 RepID=A0A1W1IAA6_9BACT|nr:PEP-CTERM sorting domain-containing protein [Nitrospira japonica]SLM49954.1 protein of unknown function [Nitrospira japonica]
MRDALLGILLVVILSIGLFAPQAEAAGSLPAWGSSGAMATWDSNSFLAWLASTLRNYIGNSQNNYPTKSVPVPGTLLFAAGGFIGLVLWRERKTRS